MGLTDNTSQDLTQGFYNQVIQESQQLCQATSTVYEGDSTVIIDNVSVDGDLTGINYQVSTDASCLMVSGMESSIQSMLSAIASQSDTDESDIFSFFETPVFNSDKESVYQIISNNIYQTYEATCQASNSIATGTQYVYIANAEVGGNLTGIDMNSSTSANCMMNNMMKNVTYVEAGASADQEVFQEGMFGEFFNSMTAIITGIVVIVIVLGVVLVATAAFKGKGSKGTQQQPNSITIPLE